jgi:carotenoid 1,2-hydratase
VVPGGYAWWYLDALSEDGEHGVVVIAFVGSVFSPYYARARHRDAAANPLAHCAINISLYRGAGRLWSMTERGARSVERGADFLRIGPSGLAWDRGELVVRIDEVTVPWPSRMRGEIRLRPLVSGPQPLALDAAGRHRWWPVAPAAEVEVAMSAPSLRWRGRGYLDSNRGDEPLARGFRAWHWARAHLRDGSTAVTYDACRRDGSSAALALRFGADGVPRPFDAPPEAGLGRGAWGIRQNARCDAGGAPHIVRRYEDGPFYTRSLIATRWLAEPVHAMHESLDLDRLERGWVQALLPFRMPRRAGG